jgi:tetratricopeptide (TPR) repeat protein
MISTNLGDAWYYSRQYDKALDQYRRTLDLHPHFLGAVIGTHAVWLARGEYRRVLDDANRWAAIYPEDPAVQTERAIAAARLGDKRILPHAQVAEFQRAYVYVARGDKDLAISALSKAFAAGEDLSMLAVDPLFDDLRGDPRFAALLARL